MAEETSLYFQRGEKKKANHSEFYVEKGMTVIKRVLKRRRAEETFL